MKLKPLQKKIVLPVTVAMLAAAAGIYADTGSWPVSVAIPEPFSGQVDVKPVSVAVPTGMSGELVSKPVSIAVPTGMSGEMISRPVSVALPTTIASGDYIARPATVGVRPANFYDPDLVGLWHMDGDWGDSSGNNNHGIPYNGSTFSSTGKVGVAAGNFDGTDDYMEVPTSSLLRPAQLTVAAWVKPQTSGVYKTIVTSEPTQGSSQVGYGIRQRTNDRFWFTLGREGQGVATIESQTALVPGNWYHLVGTYDGNQVKLYINGTLDVPPISVITAINSTFPLKIGRLNGGTEPFNGLIDEVAIYKRALTAEEVAYSYSSGISDPQAPAPPALNPIQSPVGTSTVALSGIKTPGTSVWVNNKMITAADDANTWTGTFGTLQPGINNLSVAVMDSAFRQSQSVSATVFYDNLPPVIESSIPANNSDTAKPVTAISINLIDASSSVDLAGSIQGATVKNRGGQTITGNWTVVGTKTIVFTPASTLPSDTYRVTVYPIDVVGNRGVAQLEFTNYDVTPPVSTLSISGTLGSDGWHITNVEVSISASDGSDGSGVLRSEFSFDNAVWQTYSSPFLIDTNGVKTVYYRSVDNAGNTESTKSKVIKVNKTGIVALYHMDNNWQDSSIVGNHGTAYNGAAFSSSAKIGTHAGSFDGVNDYVSIPDAPTLHQDRNITLMGWFYLNSFDKDWQSIFWKGNIPDCTTNCENREYALWLNRSGFLHLTSTPEDRVNVGQLNIETPSGTILPGGWYHFAAVISSDQNFMKIYVNGKEKANRTYSVQSIRDTSGPLYIGNNQNLGSTFNGLIDEFSIYNRALTDQEIQENYLSYSILVPTVDPVQSPTNNLILALSGTKPADTAVVVNGITVAPLDSATAWSGTYTLKDGLNVLEISAMDSGGFHSQSVGISVALDRMAPVVTNSNPPNYAILNQSVSSVTFNLSDAFSSLDLNAVLNGASVKKSGLDISGTWATSGTGMSGTVTFTPDFAMTEGSYTASIKPTDAFGNTTVQTITFTVDMTPPQAPTISPVVSPTNSSSQILNGTKGTDTVSVIVAGTGLTVGTVSYPTATTWSAAISNLKEGSNVITVYAVDSAGNQSSTVTATIVRDTVPPAQPSVNAVTSPTTSQSVLLSGAKEASSYLYINGVKTAVSYEGVSWSYTANLAEGSNTFTIYAKDEAGNQSQSASVAIVRDTTPPLVSSSTPAGGEFISQSGNIEISLSDAGSTIDLQGSLAGATVKNSSGAVVGGQWSVVSGHLLFTPSSALADSVYTVTVYPVDALGNKGTVTFTFTVDSASPAVQSLAMNPVSPIKAQAVAFTINFNEDMLTSVQPTVFFTRGGSNPVYSIPSGSWTNSKTWSGSYTFTTATGDGNYTIKVSGAKDKAGNIMAANEAYVFILDAVAPVVPTANPVVSPTKNSSITIGGTKDPESYLYVNNVKTTVLYSDTAWSHAVNLSEGNNSITIYAKDEAGNQSQSVALNVVRDTTAPAISSSTPAANAFVSQAGTTDIQLSDTYSTVDLQGSLVGAVVKNSSGSVISGQWSVVGSKLVFTPSAALTDSVYTVTLYPVDSLGNKGTGTFSFTLDSTPPLVQSLAMTPDSPHKAETVTLTVTFNEDMLTSVQPTVTFSRGFFYSTYTVSGSWANSRTWNGTSQFTTNNGDGTYTVKVAGAQDKAQNSMTAQSSWSFVLDTTPPDSPTVNAVTTPTKTPTVALSGTKPADTAIIINGSQRVALNSSTTWSYTYNLSEGLNSLSITARDAAGNDSVPVTSSIVLDTTPPNFSVNYVTPSPTQSQTLTGAKEPGCVVKLNGSVIFDATDQNGTWSYTVTLIEGLSSHLVFTAADSLGNTTTKAIDILYDLSAPAPLAEGMLVADGSGKGTEVTLSWPSYVESVDLAYYRVYSAKSNFTTTSGITAIATTNKGTKTFKATGLTQGTTYYFAVVPVDISGNSDAAVHTASAVPTDTAAPEEITGLTAQAGFNSLNGNYIKLNWTASANSIGDMADQVIYFDGGTGYDSGTSIGKSATSYLKSNLKDALKYKFKITTKDAAGHESTGVVAEAVTRLGNPTGLTAAPGNQKVTLTWGAVSSPYVKQYNIYRAQSSAQQYFADNMTLIKSLTSTSFTDTNLTNGAAYQYAVTVVNSYGAEKTDDLYSISATPRGDTTGPVISGLNITQNQVISSPVTITATAQDAESAMGKMEIYVDGALMKSQTGGTVSYFWNVVDATDGNHSIKIAAYDSLGNVTEQIIPVVVSLAPPSVPTITGHTNTATTPQYLVTVNGTAPLYTSVTLRVNSTVIGSQQASASTFAFTSVPLIEGDNLISAKTSHRGGDSAWSPDYKVTVDTGAPNAPASLAAKALAGGMLQFTWQAGPGEVPTGYNLYVSNTSFASKSDAGVTKVNTSPITFLFKEYIPADDNKKYYAATALDGAGNESGISNVVSIASDRTSPTLADIKFYTSNPGPLDTPASISGPGSVQVAITINEPLSELPFLSLEPQSGSPIVVSVKKSDDTHYDGSFTLDSTSPHGSTTYKFSGKDLVGNRGNSSGPGLTIDVKGPVATIISPLTLLKTSTGPSAVTLTFDEPSVSTPSLELKASNGISASVTGLTSTDNGIHWNGTVDPSALPDGKAQFVLTSSQDRFGNKGATVKTGSSILLYKDNPPAPAVPDTFTAKAVKGGGLQLVWGKVTDAQGYSLYRRGQNETSPALVHSITANETLTYTDIPPSDGTYLYSISAMGLLNTESVRSAEVSAISDRTPPAVPTGLTLSITGNGVQAAWATVEQEEIPASYRLYRSDGSISDISSLTPVALVKTTTATDPAPTSAKRFYAVTALDALGNESSPSTTEEIVFPVAPVRNLILTRIDSGKPTLSWEAGESNLQGFHIYRNGSRITQTPTLSTTYSDGYYSGGTITYGISAVNYIGTESPIKEATLPVLNISLKEGTTLRRGVLETVPVIASISTDATENVTIDSIALKIGTLPESTQTGPFVVMAAAPIEIKKVAATEAVAPPEEAVLITAILNPTPGTTVKITKSSTANVIGSGTALEIFNEPLIRGTVGKVRIKVNNLGSARTDILTSENNGPTNQVKVNLRDQDGNILATGKLDQRTGAVVNSGNYATARIEPGNSFLSDPITFNVPAFAPYKVVIEADIQNTYYHYSQTDQVTAPGLKQLIETTISEVAYTVQAQAGKAIYKQGENITITGQARSTSDGQPMPNVPVKIGISVKGFDRYFTATTDTNGNFSYTFTPGASETGTYSLWAIHPDLSDRTVQAQFNIIGLSVSPTSASVRMLKNQSLDIPVTLKNLSGSDLTGLTLTPSTTGGLTAAIINNNSDTLAGWESRNITLRLTPQQGTSDTAYATLAIDTAEGLTNKVEVSATLVNALPIINTSPSYIDTGLVRGTQKIQTFTITNTGLDTLKNASIEGPSTTWLSLTVEKNIGDIGVNQNKEIGIVAKPGEDVQQGVYNDKIVIYSDNHIPYTYNIQVTITSNAIGNVLFDVLNVFMEDVPNATITLQHQKLFELLYTVKTGADGTAMLYDIPEGRYTYNVSASNHIPTSGTFDIAPGVTTPVYIALDMKLVDISWSVEPIVIEDRYEIKISQTFETNVPVPVLITEPPVTNLPEMQPGQVFNGEFTVKNYGLIAADNVRINFPTSFGEYDIEVLTSSIPNKIPAMGSITVPYRITRRLQTSSLILHPSSLFDEVVGYGGGSCVTSFNMTASGDYTKCPNTPQQSQGTASASHTISVPQTCPTSTSSGGGGYVYTGGSTTGSQGGGGTAPPGASEQSLVDPCQCKQEGDCCAPQAKCKAKVCSPVILKDVEATVNPTEENPHKKIDYVAVKEEVRLIGNESHNDLCDIEYEWDFGDGTPPVKSRSTAHKYERPGTYTAKFTPQCTKCGPKVPDTVTVIVEKKCGPDVTVFLTAEQERYARWGEYTGAQIASVLAPNPYDQLGEIYRIIRLYNIGSNVVATGNGMNQNGWTYKCDRCPSIPTCNRTVTVCGKCIDLDTDFIGNYLFGHAVHAITGGFGGVGVAYSIAALKEFYDSLGLNDPEDFPAMKLGYGAYGSSICGSFSSYPTKVEACQQKNGIKCNNDLCDRPSDTYPQIDIIDVDNNPY